ncbi:NAD(P)H:quinone oxidoreductase, type IV [Piptocephalis cylindrospora]|uniref:NAD(P)H:quinone oxidoreductase, type IV n=1 Tax=Piptocephalis cylindrospora TaxID=1907219 RepID=A0A4P9Y6Q9_9FUNG|nr:NAD(P)H:quinone oxidoreductase, type IV [Piptocephalis cylindrospora]|eukprot:RKP13911.1 NAD(P)H:quinone oxidoreductase, type IV [Piptocephalis cylindrospora]
MVAKLNIIIYSMYGHVYTLAKSIQMGAQKVPGVEVTLSQIAETLSDEVLTKMHAPPKPELPIMDPSDLPNYDGYLFGIPTRYGNSPAQWRTFWDKTGGLWAKGGLVGKSAGTFFSTGSQHGGQETTALTFITTLAHHGINYVPLGYTHPALTDNSEVVGGSAYGAGTVVGGDGSRQPSEKELSIAAAQGEAFARYLVKQTSS